MTIQDLPRQKELKTSMTLQPKKQTGAVRSASLRAGLHAYCQQTDRCWSYSIMCRNTGGDLRSRSGCEGHHPGILIIPNP